MRVHLIAVQAELKAEHYRSEAAFRGRVLDLTEQAVSGLPEGEARVIGFPEAFALPLVFWLDTPQSALEHKTSLQAALELLRQDWPGALRQGVLSPSVLFHLRSGAVWPVYEGAFREAAKQAGAYVFAGSVFSPLMDWEPSRRLHPEGKAVYNVSLVLSPQGTVLARVPKVNLTASERAAFLTPGAVGQQVVRTRIGTVSNLICLDAFHENLVEQADAAGAWLVVQPSANAARWDGPWGTDPAQVEGEVWLREGLAKKLAGRENLRYGINPMLNGALYDARFEGRSGVYAAGKALALADAPTGDALVRASVEIDT